MKRLLILVILFLAVTSLFAATDKTLNKEAFVEWEFKPEVSTYAGYNLDVGGMGLEGKAKVEITSTLFEENDVEFSEDKKPYGYIKIEDLEIKISAKQEGTGKTKEEYKSSAYKSVDEKGTKELSISWGTVEGVIYIGPVYIKLAHDGHGNQGFIEKGLDDGDLDYSVINYSILSASDTAQYKGARKIKDGKFQIPDKIFDYRISDVKDESKGGDDSLASQLAETNNAFSVGFKQDKLFDIRMGITSAGSYKTYQRNNPIQLSLFFELLAIENLVVKLQTTAIAGVHPKTGRQKFDDEGGFLSEGNPLTMGVLLGYKLPIGANTLTPSLGLEFSLENGVNRYGAVALTVKNTAEGAGTGGIPANVNVNLASTKDGEDKKAVDVTAYEVALGVKYDWKSLGRDEDEDDHVSAPEKNVKVTDGVSLGLLYGSMPHAVFREFNNSYIGAKISAWDSQDDDKPGILPVKLALIINYNYVFGGEYEAKDFVGKGNYEVDIGTKEVPNLKVVEVTASDTKYTIGARQDAGLLLETSMTLGFIKPFVNTALRMYNITNSTELEVEHKMKVEGRSKVDAPKTKFYELADKADLRVKLGFDVVNLVKNVTFSAWWESGNVLKSDKVKKDLYNNSGNNSVTYYTTKDTLDKLNSAKLGFVALGAKIEY